MTRFILLLGICFVAITASSQSIESFISKVNDNHPDIIAARELLNAQEEDSHTGLTPDDPMVNFGYFPGKPDNVGNKITWSVSQSIDFPTRYRRIKDLKKTNLELAELEFNYSVLLILNSANLKAIDLISSRKQLDMYSERLGYINELENAYSKMLDLGETTIIEYSKIKMMETSLIESIRKVQRTVQSLEFDLNYMSNGNGNMLKGASYQSFDVFDPDSVLGDKRIVHPAFKIPMKELEISEREINLTRTTGLPVFEFGYASEVLANEEFTGPTVGMSIPIWKNKGKVKTAIAVNTHYRAKADSEIKFLEARFRNDYNSWLSVKSSLESLRDALSVSDNRILLSKALDLGEISLIDYFIELSAYYEIEDNLLTLEKDYNLHLARIFDHIPGVN